MSAFIRLQLCLAAAFLSVSTADAGSKRGYVLGMDGQPTVRLDTGRRLDRYPLGRISGGSLSSIEKLRLDARRIGHASQLDDAHKLDRLVAIVQTRLPRLPDESRYERVGANERSQHGYARLSAYVEKKAGLCRERAFLLARALGEAGMRARVRYGEVYTDQGSLLGGHAWVETNVGGEGLLVDPSMPSAVTPLRTERIAHQVDGQTRVVRAVTAHNLLYIRTSDLVRMDEPR